VDALHARLSWMRVDERLACRLILFLNKVCSSQKPVSLSLQLSPANERHGYNTRPALSGHFTCPLPRTNALKKSVMYRAVAYWHVLPSYATLPRNKCDFKRTLKAAIIRKEIIVD